MTLGGLALAVGHSSWTTPTVEVENINRNLDMGKPVLQAILDGAQQIAVAGAGGPRCAFCIVFLPMFLLGGVARYLFVPLAEAVIFAMLASYLLSRTLVPTIARYLLSAARSSRVRRRREIRWPARSRAFRTGVRAGSPRLPATAHRPGGPPRRLHSRCSWPSVHPRSCSRRDWARTFSPDTDSGQFTLPCGRRRARASRDRASDRPRGGGDPANEIPAGEMT